MSPVLCPCSGWSIDAGMSRPKNGHHPNCELADDEEDTLLFEESAESQNKAEGDSPISRDCDMSEQLPRDEWLARIAEEYRKWFTYHGSRPEYAEDAAEVKLRLERMRDAKPSPDDGAST